MKIRISRDQFWRLVSNVSFVVMILAMLTFLSCTAAQVKNTSDTVAAVATAAQSILPPPFGVLAGLVVGGAGLVSTMAAAHLKGNSLAAGQDPHPIADFVSSHSWVMPTFGAIVGMANAMGWIHVSPTELGTLLGSLGLATVGQVVADNHAESKAPDPATPTPPLQK